MRDEGSRAIEGRSWRGVECGLSWEEGTLDLWALRGEIWLGMAGRDGLESSAMPMQKKRSRLLLDGRDLECLFA